MVTFEDFQKSFSKAEEDIKYAELSIGSLESIENESCDSGATPRGIVVPSINELRYAAKHISNALTGGISDDDKNVQVDKAIRHCVRARLDALKATVYFLSQHFHRFSQDYSLCNLSQEVRDRQNEIREKIIDALKAISQSNASTTDEECDILRTKIQELHGFYLEVEKQRDVFNQLLHETQKLLDVSQKHEKSSIWFWVIGIGIAYVLGKWF